MERTTAPPALDFPLPWEDRPISRERWQRHRERLMRNQIGSRPCEWWRWEHGTARPEAGAEMRVLFEMGELRSAELKQVLAWFRDFYDDAHEMDDRTDYWRWEDIPEALVEKWDAERAKRERTIAELGKLK